MNQNLFNLREESDLGLNQEAEHTKNPIDVHSVANSLNDDSNLDISIDLRSYLNKRKPSKPDTLLNSIVDKQLLFLKNNSNLINKTEKHREIEKVLEENRVQKSTEHKKSQFKNVKAKLIQDRNPNVKNFLKDINETTNSRSNSELSLDKLQESLKKEFSSFLNTTVDNSLERVKKVNNRPTEKTAKGKQMIFITQQNDDSDQEIGDILNSSSRANRNEDQPKEKSKINESKMQIALIENDDEEKAAESQKSVIRLKKMIDAIKKIDLPKFQTELHQICQYGEDPQLFKFYPKVNSYLE